VTDVFEMIVIVRSRQ